MGKISTYGELLQKLGSLTNEELNKNVTVVDSNGEYYGICFELKREEEDDVIDKGHPYLKTDKFEVSPCTY